MGRRGASGKSHDRRRHTAHLRHDTPRVLRNQVANLARGCGERAAMVVRRLARYSGDQAFEIVGHAVLP